MRHLLEVSHTTNTMIDTLYRDLIASITTFLPGDQVLVLQNVSKKIKKLVDHCEVYNSVSGFTASCDEHLETLVERFPDVRSVVCTYGTTVLTIFMLLKLKRLNTLTVVNLPCMNTNLHRLMITKLIIKSRHRYNYSQLKCFTNLQHCEITLFAYVGYTPVMDDVVLVNMDVLNSKTDTELQSMYASLVDNRV